MAKKGNKKIFAKVLSDLQKEPLKLMPSEEMRPNPATNYPLFSFKYLKDKTHKDCNESRFFIKFLERLNRLSSLGWREIEKSDRHSFGTEKINISDVRPEVELPSQFEKYTYFTVFRATGDNHVFAGIRESNTFHIFYIESEFGTLYNHD
ncbi:hypothetical protein [uncultured Duncaniella sp.]|uniref:hypothetical protein n=1 Tax=uncultured Duncaniella sp. TaxID=2768039 RepID=UPI00272C4F4D|nr:hypothetical protein [uncultured Duncaniella sp.]